MVYDPNIREPLFEFLEMHYGKCRILEEMNIGNSRADVVMVTDQGTIGLEIKSDADSYTRLAGQVKDYDIYFDRNYVVAGTRHAFHIKEHVPAYWGIITVEAVPEAVSEGLDFYILRQPQANPLVSWKKKLELLWKPELSRIQETFGMPKYKEKKRTFVAEKIGEWILKGKIPAAELQREYTEILFERDYTTAEAMLEEYRKGEIQKRLEQENDPAKQITLKTEQLIRKEQLRSRGKRRPGGKQRKRV